MYFVFFQKWVFTRFFKTKEQSFKNEERVLLVTYIASNNKNN